ncbi:MAG TPA: AI-2E family transporter [Methylophilaceae bacterium]|jgi:predicted PurR-regulated permease PerM
MTTKRENNLPDYRWIALSVALLLLVYLLKPILAPFLIAAILAYICSPLVDRLGNLQLGRFSVGRTAGTVLIMLLLVGIVTTLILIVVPLLQKEVVMVLQRLPSYISALSDRMDPWLMKHFGVAPVIDPAQIRDMLSQNWKTASNYAGQLLSSVSSHGLVLLGWVINLLLVPVVLFYLLRDWHELVARVAQLLPRRWFDKTSTIAREIDLVLAEFLRGQLSVMLLMSVFYAAGLWFVGLELAIPIGLVAGLLGFVPYLGITTGIVLATLAAALQFSSLSQLIPVFVVFGAGQVIEGMLLTPLLVGDRIGLHPVVVIFSLLAGGQLFGFAGILLALPVSAAIAVGLRHAKRSYLASDIYLK